MVHKTRSRGMEENNFELPYETQIRELTNIVYIPRLTLREENEVVFDIDRKELLKHTGRGAGRKTNYTNMAPEISSSISGRPPLTTKSLNFPEREPFTNSGQWEKSDASRPQLRRSSAVWTPPRQTISRLNL